MCVRQWGKHTHYEKHTHCPQGCARFLHRNERLKIVPASRNLTDEGNKIHKTTPKETL